MRGLAKRMPVTMTCFTIASLGIAGLPLMAGFVSKFNLIRGILAMGQPFFAVVLVAAALLALSYLMPVARIVFDGGEGAGGSSLRPSLDTHGYADPARGRGARDAPSTGADDDCCSAARLCAECRPTFICAGANGGSRGDRRRWRICGIKV